MYSLTNFSLVRQDSSLDSVRHGVKVYTVAAPASLFSEDVISRAEEEIGHHEDKQYSGGSLKKSDLYSQ